MRLDGGPTGIELHVSWANDGVKWGEDSGGPWCPDVKRSIGEDEVGGL